MTDKTNLDIALRIAHALSLTSEPQPPTSGSVKGEGKIIGSVPVHLRHLHNLLNDLVEEVQAAELNLRAKVKILDAVRTVFFDALKTQVPAPENASDVRILENWDVVADLRSDDDGEMDGLAELLAQVAKGGSYCQ